MDPKKKSHHFLILFLPFQSHINPSLQLAKNLARYGGAKVTLATTHGGLKQMKSLPSLNGLSYAAFTDENDDDYQSNNGFSTFVDILKIVGPKNLINLIQRFSDEGRPVTVLVYSILLPWVAEVAREFHLPSAFHCIQSATVFTIYQHFFNSRDGIHCKMDNMDSSIKPVPELPLFSSGDLPTFLLPGNPSSDFLIPWMKEHIRVLEEVPKSSVLVNTFQELEQESIKVVDTINVISVGPLIPSAFCNGDDLTDKSFGGDLFDKSDDYFHWLDSKPTGSVIYGSFGSLAVLKKEQKEEIFHALMEINRPFLWVLREEEENEYDEVKNGLINGDGIIVQWCSQVEVLSHRSIGCFVTHCGWNSTLESVVCSVPIIGCPQFSDQTTNAKMVEEVWGVGVRARANEERIIERGELKKCLDIVMGGGDRGKEMRENVGSLRDLAVKAVKEGGSSYKNLKKVLEIT